jgi:hypothetical protein
MGHALTQEQMPRFMRTLSIAACAAIGAGAAFAQSFGGSPPWGLEKPTYIKGEVSQGQAFEYPIGNGLRLTLTPMPDADEWNIQVASGDGDDYSTCVTPPFHGPNARQIMGWHFQAGQEMTPGAVGQKRWIEFVLSSEDHEAECKNLETGLYGKDRDWSNWGTHISGRCWFRPLTVELDDGKGNEQGIKLLTFDAECALRGALELWRLPATYVIPDDFSGWVMMRYRQKGKPELPRKGDRYVVGFDKSATVRTSSDLRQDSRSAEFVWKNGRAAATKGPHQTIWGWVVGDADMCSPFQSFFVGTGEQYRKNPENPALKNPYWDCSQVLRVKR